MNAINILDAKTSLSRLVHQVEQGDVAEHVIARNGRPVARLVPMAEPRPPLRLGLHDGRHAIPEPDPELDAEIAASFLRA